MTGSYSEGSPFCVSVSGPVEVFGPGASTPAPGAIEARFGSIRSDWLLKVPSGAKVKVWLVATAEGLKIANEGGGQKPIYLNGQHSKQSGSIRFEVGEESSLELYECWGLEELSKQTHDFHIEIDQRPRSLVKRLKIATRNDQRVDACRVFLGRESVFSGLQIVMSQDGAKAHDQLTVVLTEPGARASLSGLSLATGTERVDIQSTVIHEKGQTQSRQTYKALVGDRARSRFVGEVRIQHGAAQADAAQMHRSFLLDARAESLTEPRLDIQCDDVKAAHGAAMGQLDPEHIFYLMSRGLSRSTAIQTLSRGFALEVLDVFGDEPCDLRTLAQTCIERGADRLGLDTKSVGNHMVQTGLSE